MAVNDLQLDPQEVSRLLDELTARLIAAGISAQIHIIGGSAMALLFPSDAETRMTQDIDAAFQPTEEVRRIIDEMATDLGLSRNWMNSNGAPFIPPRSVAVQRSTGVTVSVATIEELIAMKLAASREQDLHDLGILARAAGITSADRLVEIAFAAYGEDSLVLNETRGDYLLMARQALSAARKRAAK